MTDELTTNEELRAEVVRLRDEVSDLKKRQEDVLAFLRCVGTVSESLSQAADRAAGGAAA